MHPIASRPVVSLSLALLSATLLLGCGGSGEDPSAPLPTGLVLDVPARVETAQTLSLRASGSTPVAAGLEYSWNFGDGQTSAEAQPRHSYAAPGRYEVTLTLRNAAGQQLQLRSPVQVGHFSRLAGRQCSGSADQGWCWMNPLPFVSDVRDLHFTDQRLGSAVGDAGFVLLSDDGGRQWRRLRTPLTDGVALFRRSSERQGWIIGQRNPTSGVKVISTVDAGQTWREAAPLTLTLVDKAWVTAPGTLVVSGFDGFFRQTWVTENDGLSWRRSVMPAEQITASGVHWRLREFEGLQLSTDGGRTAAFVWQPPRLARIMASNLERHPRIVLLYTFLVDEQGGPGQTFRALSTDGGANWQTERVLLPAELAHTRLERISLGAGGRALATAVDDAGAIPESGWMPRWLLRSEDDGLRWALLQPPAAVQANIGLPGSFPVTENILRLNTSFWQVLPPNPLDWREILPLVSGNPFSSVASWPSGPLAGTTLRSGVDQVQVSADQGQTWSVLPGSPDLTLAPFQSAHYIAGLHFFDVRQGVLLRSDGLVRTTDDGGRSWQPRPVDGLSAQSSARDLQFTLDGVGHALFGGQLRRSVDRGATWQKVPLPLGAELFLMNQHFADGRRGWVFGRACTGPASDPSSCQAVNRLYSTADGGATWVRRSVPPGTELPSGLFHLRKLGQNAGLLWTAWGIWRSDDDGQSWQPATTADGGQPWTDFNAGWSLGAAHFIDGQRGWLTARAFGPARQLLLRTTDGGRRWRVSPLPADVDLGRLPNDFRMLDASRGWLVGWDGRILATTDGGDSWQRQDAQTQRGLTSVFALDPETVWIGGEYEVLLGSATGGR